MSDASNPTVGKRVERTTASELFAGKWTMAVVCTLQKSTLRYGAIEKAIPSITQRALTLTLRKLELNGMLNRYVHPSVPPQVEYKLTSLGLELLQFCETMTSWTEEREADIQRARKSYARRLR